MTRGIATRVAGLRPTAVNSVLREVRQLQAEGRDLVSLMRGQPDTPTPAHIVEAARPRPARRPDRLSGQSGRARPAPGGGRAAGPRPRPGLRPRPRDPHHRRGHPRPLHRPGRPRRAGRRRPAARPDLRRLRLADRASGEAGPWASRPRSATGRFTFDRAGLEGELPAEHAGRAAQHPLEPRRHGPDPAGAPGPDGLRRGARPLRHQRRDLRDARLRRPGPPVAGRVVGGGPGADACS